MKKKILMLNYEFPPLGGGAGNATYNLLKEFSGVHNVEIHLITSSLNGYKEEDFSNNIKIYYLDIYKRGNLHSQSLVNLLTYSMKAYFFAKRLVRKERYDLVHAFFGIPCGFLALKLGMPYIVSLRGSDVPFYNSKYFLLDKVLFARKSRKIWRNASFVVANSNNLKDLALHVAPDQRINLIFNGVNLKMFRPLTKNRDANRQKFTVISTSRFTGRKGLKYLLNAFKVFSDQNEDSRLILIGDGEQKDELQDFAYKADLEHKVIFPGRIDNDKLNKYYQEADVFVLPSFNEGMSNSLLEALASGLAVVSTETGDASLLVENGLNGFLIKQGSVDSIVSALTKIYANQPLLEEMKRSSRRKVEMMSWELVAKEYLFLYMKIQ